MQLKDSEKSMILILIGAAVLVLSFMYIVKPNYEEIQSLKAESQQLQARLTDLQQKQARRDEYLAGIDEYTNAFEEVLAEFPADLNQEITIMFLQGIKNDNKFKIDALTLGEPEQFYTLGLGGGDATLSTGTDASADTATEASTEAASTEAASQDGTLEEGEIGPDPNAYTCYRADFPIQYNGSYESLKNVIDYIDGYNCRMTINSIDIAYDADENLYTGNLDLKCYSIESAERPERSLELNDIETGVDNIFTSGGTGSSSQSSSLKKYDENDGAAIENNYDFYAMLNPSTSDVSAKVVGQNGTGKEASVISNSDNTVSTLTYDFYEVDGKNYCKYTLDNSKSYEAEITSAEDIKLLFQSSARKDGDDKVGIRVTIRNTTSLPVYVKVSGEDAASPRVDIVSKSGSVKVY